jgi:hypothetical protein
MMHDSGMMTVLKDNGGRRLDIDRRQFSYTNYIPDRRLCENRRACIDRRNSMDQRRGTDRRRAKIIKIYHGKELRKREERRSGLERRATFATG